MRSNWWSDFCQYDRRKNLEMKPTSYQSQCRHSTTRPLSWLRCSWTVAPPTPCRVLRQSQRPQSCTEADGEHPRESNFTDASCTLQDWPVLLLRACWYVLSFFGANLEDALGVKEHSRQHANLSSGGRRPTAVSPIVPSSKGEELHCFKCREW